MQYLQYPIILARFLHNYTYLWRSFAFFLGSQSPFCKRTKKRLHRLHVFFQIEIHHSSFVSFLPFHLDDTIEGTLSLNRWDDDTLKPIFTVLSFKETVKPWLFAADSAPDLIAEPEKLVNDMRADKAVGSSHDNARAFRNSGARPRHCDEVAIQFLAGIHRPKAKAVAVEKNWEKNLMD